jgi:hypothetical protein
MNQAKKCDTSEHIESIERPGFCVWCNAPMRIGPALTTALQRIEREERFKGDVFTNLARKHAAELGVLLRAVSEGAILTLGPGTRRCDVAATLESNIGDNHGPRYALVQGATLETVLRDLVQKWCKQ